MVEVDETYIGGKEKNKHFNKRRSFKDNTITNEGKVFSPKKTIVGILERSGKVVLKHLENAQLKNMGAFISKHVYKGSTIYSDEEPVYNHMKRHYTHDSVKHAINIYVMGNVCKKNNRKFLDCFKAWFLRSLSSSK